MQTNDQTIITLTEMLIVNWTRALHSPQNPAVGHSSYTGMHASSAPYAILFVFRPILPIRSIFMLTILFHPEFEKTVKCQNTYFNTKQYHLISVQYHQSMVICLTFI